MTKKRNKQCKACPWRKDVVPSKDIPNNYCPTKHAALKNTIARGDVVSQLSQSAIRIMACHESKPGREYPCIGWLVNQLRSGNNIPLRFVARDGRFKDLQTVGEQHKTFEDTLGEDR